MNTPNTELQRGLKMMQARFPDCYVSVEESTRGKLGTYEIHEYRLTVVNGRSQASGQSAPTIDAAFAAVVADYEKPRTEEINRAKALLAAEGFEVTKTEQ